MEELITSGKLELFVTGSLPLEERDAVTAMIKKHPEVRREVEKIEQTLLTLGATVAPPITAQIWTTILKGIDGVKYLPKEQGTNWTAITGWAAAVACMIGLFWSLNEKNSIQNDFDIVNTKNVVLTEEKTNANTALKETTVFLEILKDKDYKSIALPGNQAVSPDAFATVYFNAKEGVAVIDASGLPIPPADKEYQVWSLIMDPLTPSSMGLFNKNTAISSENQVYKFENLPETQAFGITLEPKGGSESPNLAQLYTLGAVAP